jgi:hypothetical protein
MNGRINRLDAAATDAYADLIPMNTSPTLNMLQPACRRACRQAPESAPLRSGRPVPWRPSDDSVGGTAVGVVVDSANQHDERLSPYQVCYLSALVTGTFHGLCVQCGSRMTVLDQVFGTFRFGTGAPARAVDIRQMGHIPGLGLILPAAISSPSTTTTHCIATAYARNSSTTPGLIPRKESGTRAGTIGPNLRR